VSRSFAYLFALLPAVVAAGDLVGPETCKACHPGAYATWRAGPHARALESLPERSRKDPRCLSCHAPQIEDGISGVSCESCHGPGSAYAASYVMRDAELARAVGLVDPGEKTCIACHTESTPSLQRFVYDRKLKLIAHPDTPPAAAPPRPATPAAPAAPAHAPAPRR
jgi:formate-dependent nitrite reductase cytochrome c552 subunit